MALHEVSSGNTKRYRSTNKQPAIVAFRGKTTVLLVNSDAEIISESNIDMRIDVERTFIINPECIALVDFNSNLYTFNTTSCALYLHEKQTTAYNIRLNDYTILFCNEIDYFETYNIRSQVTEMKQIVKKHQEPAVVKQPP